jgi:hypothetical protein
VLSCDNFVLSFGQKQVDCYYTIPPYGTMKAGACGSVFQGSTCSNTTYLRVLAYAGVTLADSSLDGSCSGCGVTQYFNNASTPLGVVLRSSCWPVGSAACSAVTKVTLAQAPAPPMPPPLSPPPRPPPSPPPMVAGTAACTSYSITPVNKYQDCRIEVPSGYSLYAGGCGIDGATCYGDTTALVMSYFGRTLASNDDGPVAVCGLCSLVDYTNTGFFSTTVWLRQQCSPLKSGFCGGTSMYRLVAPGGVTRRALLAVSEETKDEEEEKVQELADPWAQVPKTAKSWPVWLIITIGVGVALSVVLLVTIIVCTEKRRRKGDTAGATVGAARRVRMRRAKSPESITGVKIEL